MSTKRKQHSAQFKFEIAVEAVKGLQTINQVASSHSLHPNQVSEWKGHLLERGATLFSKGSVQPQREAARREAELYEQIGRLKMELEWLKKTSSIPSRSNE
jgi:transposase-like protein